MKKTRQRIASVLTACLLAGTLVVPTFAAELDGGKVTTDDTELTVPKAILVVNDGFNKTWCPGITFTFSVAPAEVADGATITDAEGNTISVLPGPAGGLTVTENAVIEAHEVTEADAGATSLNESVSADITLSVDLSQFTSPGVYRYVISDTTTAAALANAGIVRSGDYDGDRNIDVYIIDDGNGPEVHGYVVTDELPGSHSITHVDGSFKVDGYDINTDLDPTPVEDPGEDEIPGTADDHIVFEIKDNADVMDTYTSYNISVNKQITGNMGDTAHAFPFTAELVNGNADSTASDNFYFQAHDAQAASAANLSSDIADGLANDDTMYLYGLNPFMAATIQETNDTPNAYKVTTSDGTLNAVAVAAGDDAETTIDLATEQDNVDLVVTNNLNSPSETGFLMRIAPFAILAGALAAVFTVSKLKFGKKGSEE